MRQLLEYFWKWIPISYEEYAIKGINQSNGSYEDNFPCFSELLAYAEMIVKNDITTDDCIDDLLTIMAIDNEAESILELIEKDSSDYQLSCIISKGITHPLYGARWQLAEIVYRRKPPRYKSYLYTLSNDSHSYVRRRASNCISYDNLN